MLIDVNVEIDSDRVHIQIPRAQISVEIPQAGAISESERTRQQKATNGVDKKQEPETESLSPFDIEHFNPYLVAEILRYYIQVGRSRLRPGVGRIWPFDHLRYNIRLPHYEELPGDMRAEFEYILITYLRADRSSSINGQSVRRLYWKHSAPDIMLAFLIVLWMIAPLVIGSWIIVDSELNTRPVFVLDIALILVISILVVLACFWGAVVSWVLTVRRCVPKGQVMRRLCMMLPKSAAGWLERVLLSAD